MERNRSGNLRVAYDLASQIGKNLVMGSATVRKWRLKRPRTSTFQSSTLEYLEYHAFASLNSLLEHAGEINGRTVCEIGPGDYLTSGLSILAAGARRYCIIDRFEGNYYSDAAKRWYKDVKHNWPWFFPDRPWPEYLHAELFPEKAMDRLEIIDKPIETAAPKERYDILCSFQVAEHVSDIQAFADIHNLVLTDDGVGVHRVDFGPHDCWFYYRDRGMFLRFSDAIWNLTGSNRGVPNRRRHHEFLEAFERANLDVEILLTETYEPSDIELAKLNARFRDMPTESLLTVTAVYRIRRRRNQ